MEHAVRLLRKSPVFTAVAVATLALGIGANTALFSLVNAILLKQLPFEHASRLIWIWSTRTDRDKAFYSLPDFVETRESCRTLDGIGAYSNWGANLSGAGEPERLQGARVTANTFELMGVKALRGRTIVEKDGHAQSERVAVLIYGLWQRRFGADPGVIGQRLILNSHSYTVIGVLSPDFVMPTNDAELFVPLVMETDPWRKDRETNVLRTFGRLKPGVTPQQAASDLASIERRLRATYPVINGKHTDPRVVPFIDEIVGGYRTALWTLLGAVGLVLLMACANLASLLYARASTRAREVAIRTALGATRAHLILQFLSESLLLVTLGGALGVALGYGGLAILRSLRPADLPRITEVSVDARVLAFALAITMLSGVIFGLAPALYVSKFASTGVLRSRSAGIRQGNRTRSLLVLGEVALSVILLSGAGLFLKTFLRMQAVSPGIAADHLLLMRLSLPKEHYGTPADVRRFYDNLRARITVLPGVEEEALASVLPLSGMNTRSEFMISGRTPASPLDVPAAQNRWVSAGYFHTMRIPVVEGREFTERDTESAAGVAVVDQACAKKYWPNRSPLGQHFTLQSREFEVVGVVGDVKHNTLSDSPTSTVYSPFPQVTPAGLPFVTNGVSLVIRTAGDPLAIATAVRRELRAVDGSVPASSVRTMDQFLTASVAPRKFNLELMMIFAAAALLLAALGLYGAVSYAVILRTPEIGIRMALGADRYSIFRLIIGQGLRLVLIGTAAGLLAAVGVARAARNLLFETSASDPVVFAAVAVVFVAVGTIAAYVPARRALRVNPLTTLQSE